MPLAIGAIGAIGAVGAIGAIGAIGYRDLVPSEIDGLRARVASFLVALQREYPQLRVTLLTSLADGADRLRRGRKFFADASDGRPADAERALRAGLRRRFAD